MLNIKNYFIKKEKRKEKKIKTKIYNNYQKNIEHIKLLFNFPINDDFIMKEIYIKSIKKKAVIIFIDVMVNLNDIEVHILEPLMEDNLATELKISEFIESQISLKNLKKVYYYDKLIGDVCTGKTVLIIENLPFVFSVETTSYASRSVQKPIRENVIKGPQEAFIESGQTNRSLIRKTLKISTLTTEKIIKNEEFNNLISIMYVNGLANEQMITEIKKRIMNVQMEIIEGIEILEQLIEERPYSIVPSILYTERPDRVISFLLQGHAVILMDNSSSCLVVPITFWDLFHAPEDMYQKWIFGNFIRLIRIFAFFLAIFTPGIFLAVTTFHTEMLPTDMLLAIAGARETIPLPLIFELLFMEVAFELIREAGIRIPTSIGPTIGIVGGIIIGQAAVQANLVSPILVVIVSLTGLSSFTLQDNSLNYMIRISKFTYLFLGGILGLVGIVIGLVLSVNYLVSFESFGTPFLTPINPYSSSKMDTIIRPTFSSRNSKNKINSKFKDDKYD